MADETLADDAVARPSFGLGSQLGKYKLLRLLGAGGMGQVWAAHDPDLDREVALKLLRADRDAPQLRTRLLREARAMARLKHPNVLTVYEVGSEGDRDYIAMELVDGMNFDQWLATQPPRDELWQALLAAGRGLAAAHDAGLVHRDFKPHNVLRSRDGRVLVTDFGLARGVGDDKVQALPASLTTPVELDVTLDAKHNNDSVLDSPLTQTGALIGTPAYMAPEQFAGTPPDPRTDQFAFCVTAWQALTGERPFQGTSLEELRNATSRGVEHLQSKLPRGVRRPLVRGLSPDPSKRWDRMDDLLRALDRPRRPWVATIAVAVAALAVLGIVAMQRRPVHDAPAKSPYGCEPIDQAFRFTWTDDARTDLQRKAGSSAELVVRYLDEYRHAWLAAYDTACKAPPSPTAFARIGCLLGARDEAGLFAAVATEVMPAALDKLDVAGALTPVAACESDTPLALPQLPAPGKQRFEIVGIRGETTMLRLDNPQKLIDERARWERAAQAHHYDRLLPLTDMDIGAAATTLGDYETARTYLGRAATDAARLRDYELEARARIALFEVESAASADPGDSRREQKLVDDTVAAIQRAGGDPELAAQLDLLVASNRLARGDVAGAEQKLAADPWSARPVSRFAARETLLRMKIAMARHEDELAYKLGRRHEADELQGGPVHAEIEKDMVELARRTGDLDDAHARADKLYETAAAADTILIAGVVTDARGTPVSHAHVVAWSGRLTGDSRRIYTQRDVAGDEAFTDETGRYTLAAPRAGAVMAEHEDLRSSVVAIAGPGAMPALAITPTHAVTGIVKAPPGTDAFVRMRAGGAEWMARTPIASDGAYRLTGVPAKAAEVGLVLGEHTVVGATTWPTGATLDVIAHVSGDVWVLRGHVSQLVGASATGDVARATLGPIGFSSETREGMATYKLGDTHAVVSDIAPGEVSICLTATKACQPVTAPAHGTLPVVIR